MRQIPLAALALALLAPGSALAKSTASSFATEAEGKHTPDLALDGLLTTGWGEGAMGHGDAAWWEFDLPTATPLESISVWPGNLSQGARSFREYPRPKLIKVYVDGAQQGEPVRLQDEMRRWDIPVNVTGKKVRIEVVEAFEGGVYADLYLAEVAVNFTEGERARAVEKVEAWRASKEGEKLQAKHEEEVLKAFDTHKADGDETEALAFLMSAAGDGPTFLRKKVGSLVPEGYRVAAIVPDAKAMDALRKLKDPNGIPGLEMAAMRSIGDAQKDILEIVEIFYAYQDIVGGGRRNIKSWGEPGWEVGALRGFNEPLALEIDRFGSIYVADTGNNRLQQFNQEGISSRQWGQQPDVSAAWFGGKRKWYASGAAPADGQSGFTNPVDIELIPGKEADEFAVLDATGRVQIFDAEGNPKIGWTARVDHQMAPKVGGEGYLAWVPKKKQLVVINGDTGVVFTLDSEEVARWDIKDGTPNSVEVGKDGKLYMAFGSEVVTYNTDGFRYGSVFGSEILGEGFEDVDLSVDEAGQLWALTDMGWAFKFKKPGKLEWKVRVSDVEFVHPRFAVSQGMLFITDRERIVKVDALQKHIDEVEAKKDEAGASGGKKGKKDGAASAGGDQ